MIWITKILVLILAFCLTEGMAWFIHKYIMHGFLWNLHKTHHQKNPKGGLLEWNDLFFLFYAILGIYLIISGFEGFQHSFFAGLGITIYGFTYLIVHDLFIHRRLKIFKTQSPNNYLSAVKRAHKMHHRHIGKEDGEAFGLLWVPKRYYPKN